MLQSPDEHPFVHAFAHRSLSAPKDVVSVFVRLLRCSTSDRYAALLEELSAYERELARATEGWRWAEAIGLELPTERPWRISAILLCVPESPAVGRVTLAVQADSVGFGVRSYRLHLRGSEPTPFSESWDDDATVARVGFRDCLRVLQTAPRLLKVPELLSELEGVLDVSFSYRPESTRLSRGVKGKARLADWLLQANTHP